MDDEPTRGVALQRLEDMEDGRIEGLTPPSDSFVQEGNLVVSGDVPGPDLKEIKRFDSARFRYRKRA